jgi:hypothetical protein
MKVHPSHTDELAPAHRSRYASAHAAKTAAHSFASVLAKQSMATAPGTDVPATTASPTSDIKLHEGESLSGVYGHPYAEIKGGERDGMYVNTSNNKRRGQAFVLVHKHGIEYHIYGHGKDRLVVALKPHKTATQPADTASGTGGVTPTVSAT